ncbi:MAG: hypothetical protein AAFV53_11840 [Myxococcota bacterium]
MTAAIAARGIPVVDAERLLAVYPDIAVGCSETPGCPTALLARADGSLAVVGAVRTQPLEDTISITVRFFAPGELEPLREMTRDVSPDELGRFADDVSMIVAAVTPAPAPAPTPTPDPIPEPLPDEEPGFREPTDEELNDWRFKGLPFATQQKFITSGVPLDAWLEQARVRTGRVFLEAFGGVAFGDVWRRYDTRVAVLVTEQDDFEQLDPYTYEAFIQGPGGAGGVSAGYALAWWLELQLQGGILLGQKELTSGWEQYDDGQLIDEDTTVYAPVSGLMGSIDPRARITLLPTGPVKPYLIAGAHLRFYDGYIVPDANNPIDFADTEGGLGFGATTGAGLAFDGPEMFTGFIEVPWTYLIAPTPTIQPGEMLQTLPTQPAGSGQMLNFRLGIGVRL